MPGISEQDPVGNPEGAENAPAIHETYLARRQDRVPGIPDVAIMK
jgi:hypothetical protein